MCLVQLTRRADSAWTTKGPVAAAQSLHLQQVPPASPAANPAVTAMTAMADSKSPAGRAGELDAQGALSCCHCSVGADGVCRSRQASGEGEAVGSPDQIRRRLQKRLRADPGAPPAGRLPNLRRRVPNSRRPDSTGPHPTCFNSVGLNNRGVQ